MAKLANIAEILANKSHVFFTSDAASDFRYANQEMEIPTGTIRPMREMSMDFYTRKCGEFQTFMALPNDEKLMAQIMRAIPGFGE